MKDNKQSCIERTKWIKLDEKKKQWIVQLKPWHKAQQWQQAKTASNAESSKKWRKQWNVDLLRTLNYTTHIIFWDIWERSSSFIFGALLFAAVAALFLSSLKSFNRANFFLSRFSFGIFKIQALLHRTTRIWLEYWTNIFISWFVSLFIVVFSLKDSSFVRSVGKFQLCFNVNF